MGSGKGERQKGVGGLYKLGKAASLERNRERLIGDCRTDMLQEVKKEERRRWLGGSEQGKERFSDTPIEREEAGPPSMEEGPVRESGIGRKESCGRNRLS